MNLRPFQHEIYIVPADTRVDHILLPHEYRLGTTNRNQTVLIITEPIDSKRRMLLAMIVPLKPVV